MVSKVTASGYWEHRFADYNHTHAMIRIRRNSVPTLDPVFLAVRGMKSEHDAALLCLKEIKRQGSRPVGSYMPSLFAIMPTGSMTRGELREAFKETSTYKHMCRVFAECTSKQVLQACKDMLQQNIDHKIYDLSNSTSGDSGTTTGRFTEKSHNTMEKSHMAIKVTNPTLINNRTAENYSNEDLIQMISDSVAEVKRLGNVGFKSKVVDAMIKSEEAGQKAAIAILDSRADAESES